MKQISKPLIVFILVFIILGFIDYAGYQYYLVYKQLWIANKELISFTNTFSFLTEALEKQVFQLKVANQNLADSLKSEKGKNEFFAEQISGIQGTVNVLEKLSKTDKELLQKYSKVYFLNEHYVPTSLAVIDSKYVYNKDEVLRIHTNVQPYLYKLLEAAASSSVPMEIISAYRSFGTQSSLKLGYKMTYGSGANQFSADQGYSEHQLGTTADLTTPELGAEFTKLENTDAYQWLAENAYKYGFILSYPKHNKYYQFEPWHWRFVGVGLAAFLQNNNQHFYDLDQREIDQYLVSIFD
jgi:LAS superfamily LD-carboxypeptidase LdcB